MSETETNAAATAIAENLQKIVNAKDEKPIANEQEVLKGENTVIIKSGDGRIGKCDVLVNGTKATFDTGKEITVSDAQLDVLRNSGRTVEEVEVSTGTKKADKTLAAAEAGAGEGSLAPAADKPKATGKAAGKGKAAAPKVEKAPASNVNKDGNTTKAADIKPAGTDDKK